MAYLSPNIVSSGLTFAAWQAKGVSGMLDTICAAMTATGNPLTAPTVAATGQSTSGGSLAAGGYFVAVTETNGIGETTTGGLESAVMTVATGNIPKVTFSALQSGNTGRNVYLTPANGASGTEVLYATGVTTATYALSAAAPSNSFATAPPTANTTGLTSTSGSVTQNATQRFILSGKFEKMQDLYKDLCHHIRNFNAGQPMAYNQVMSKFRHFATAVAVLQSACNEMGVLLDANPGTLVNSTNPIGNVRKLRQWP